jgi:hypothetical protein
MRIPSGVTDQYIYFVAVDATDYVTRETGLNTFTVYRSRNGGAAASFTTPTINETDATNMPGVYELLLDEDMTIDAGDQSQEMVFHITHAGMAPVTRTIELYRPSVTAGETLTVASGTGNAAVQSIANNAITAASIAGDAITAAKIADGAIDAATFAAGAIDAASLAADAGTEIADAILDRDMSVGADNGSASVRTVRQALRFLRNKWSIAGATLTVTKEDDTTASWTSTITTSASADPVTASDPAD